MTVKATVSFSEFNFLDPERTDEFILELFQIPSDCKFVSRKEGQKTLESKKKRMAVANLTT
jgi:hypothetical protein